MSRLNIKPTLKQVRAFYPLSASTSLLRIGWGEGGRRPDEVSWESGERAGDRCRSLAPTARSIDPNLAVAAVEEMGSTGHWPVPSGESPDGRHSYKRRRGFQEPLPGHTGRWVARYGRVASATDARRNLIAAEIGQVNDAIASQGFS